MKPLVLLMNVVAVMAAFKGGMYVEASNIAYAAGSPHALNAVLGLCLATAALAVVLATCVVLFDDASNG